MIEVTEEAKATELPPGELQEAMTAEEKLKQIEDHDKVMREIEDEMKQQAKKIYGVRSDSVSNNSSISNSNSKLKLGNLPEEHFRISSDEKFIAERTSLIRGEVQLDKYKETLEQSGRLNEGDDELEMIRKELSEDEEIRLFADNRWGVRKRDAMEIQQESEKLLRREQEHERNRERLRELAAFRQDQDHLHDHLDDLNALIRQPGAAELQVAGSGAPTAPPKKHPEIKFTDLRENQKLKKEADYSEKAKEVPEPVLNDDGDQASQGGLETKKKKKKRKKQNKKKKKETEEEAK